MGALTLNQRIELLVADLHMSDEEFGKSCQGISRQVINNLKKGKNKIAYENLIKIVESYPGLNARWLLLDEHNIKKTIYALKHTGVGMAVDAGINVRELQLQLRHSSLDMTQIYLDKFRRDPGHELRKKFPDF